MTNPRNHEDQPPHDAPVPQDSPAVRFLLSASQRGRKATAANHDARGDLRPGEFALWILLLAAVISAICWMVAAWPWGK